MPITATAVRLDQESHCIVLLPTELVKVFIQSGGLTACQGLGIDQEMPQPNMSENCLGMQLTSRLDVPKTRCFSVDKISVHNRLLYPHDRCSSERWHSSDFYSRCPSS